MKPAAANTSGSLSIDSQQVRYTGFRLSAILQDAYQVKKYQVNGPDWLNTELYDIVAKLPEGASKDDVPAMLRNLLADRFRMKVHTEIRQDRVYALVVAKNGPHLQESDVNSGRTPGMEIHGGRIEFTSVTLDAFSHVMSSYLGYPVLDTTGIPGHFDIAIAMEGGPPDTIPDVGFSSSIVAAVQELGLKLESRTAPLQHIVVDSAERIPSAN